MKKKPWLSLFPVLFVLMFGNCSAPLKVQHSSEGLNDKLEINKNGTALNKIVFLTFEVTLVDSINDLYNFKLKNTLFAPGLLKQNKLDDQMAIEPYYFYYQVSGENQKLKTYQKVQNPLQTVYEYAGENGLNKKLIQKRSGEMIVRFNYNKDSKYISFFKPDNNTKTFKTIYHALL